MTSVIVTSLNNTVVATEGKTSTVVTVVTQGPQGPQGPAGSLDSIGEIPDVSIVARVDKSLLYYDAASQKFKADTTVTTTTLTDGGAY